MLQRSFASALMKVPVLDQYIGDKPCCHNFQEFDQTEEGHKLWEGNHRQFKGRLRV